MNLLPRNRNYHCVVERKISSLDKGFVDVIPFECSVERKCSIVVYGVLIRHVSHPPHVVFPAATRVMRMSKPF